MYIGVYVYIYIYIHVSTDINRYHHPRLRLMDLLPGASAPSAFYRPNVASFNGALTAAAVASKWKVTVVTGAPKRKGVGTLW